MLEPRFGAEVVREPGIRQRFLAAAASPTRISLKTLIAGPVGKPTCDRCGTGLLALNLSRMRPEASGLLIRQNAAPGTSWGRNGAADVLEEKAEVTFNGKVSEQRYGVQQDKLFFGDAVLGKQFPVPAESVGHRFAPCGRLVGSFRSGKAHSPTPSAEQIERHCRRSDLAPSHRFCSRCRDVLHRPKSRRPLCQLNIAVNRSEQAGDAASHR